MLHSCKSAPDARSVVEKAIAAHGGKDALAKPRMGMLKGATSDGEIITEEVFDLPTQWKRTISGTIRGKKKTAHVLMRKGQVWLWDQGAEVQEADSEREFGPYIGIVRSLLELQKEGVKLSALREVMIQDRAAVGVRTEHEGIRRDYYFDKTSRLLVRIDQSWETSPETKVPMRWEFFNHKEVECLKMPYRKVIKQVSGEDKTYKFTVSGNNWTLGNDEVISQSGTLKIVDASSVPKKLDLVILTGVGKGLTVLSVYQIEGDVFSYCGSTESRPTSMKTKPGGDSYRSNFRRLK